MRSSRKRYPSTAISSLSNTSDLSENSVTVPVNMRSTYSNYLTRYIKSSQSGCTRSCVPIMENAFCIRGIVFGV